MDKLSKLKEIYIKELEIMKTLCLMKITELKKDNREDEANFEKIKVNIYEIFTTLFYTDERKITNDIIGEEYSKYPAFCQRYLDRFDKIPESWRTKLEYANKADLNSEKIVEEIKLETADSIKAVFIKTMEGVGV